MTDINQNGELVGKPKDGYGIYDQTAEQMYPIGTTLNLHGRQWKYCRAAEAITLPHRGSPCLVDYPWIATSLYSLKGVETNNRAVGVAGRKSLTVEADDYSQDTSPYSATIKNFYQGGYANIFFDTSLIATVRITGSDACTTDVDTGTSIDMVLYFDEPLPTAIVAASHIDVYPSPYICCGNSNSGTGWSSFVCVPPIAVTTQYFFWGQTKGPCWVTPNVGITATGVRDLCFHNNGTVKIPVLGLQRAGYIIYKGDNTQDDALIMLDI
jgi:hypothetical protein